MKAQLRFLNLAIFASKILKLYSLAIVVYMTFSFSMSTDTFQNSLYMEKDFYYYVINQIRKAITIGSLQLWITYLHWHERISASKLGSRFLNWIAPHCMNHPFRRFIYRQLAALILEQHDSNHQTLWDRIHPWAKAE